MHPVLLVHGYLASPSLMRPLQHRLRDCGHDTHLVPELSAWVIGDVRKHAEELDRAVDRVLRHTGADTVRLVGASQGGIIALWWAHAFGGWSRLERIVTLGTPFRGSGLASIASTAFGWASKGVQQLVPGSPFLHALESIELERPVISVSMRGDPVCPPEACLLPGMQASIVQASWGPLTHQLLMLDPRASRAVHQALTC